MHDAFFEFRSSRVHYCYSDSGEKLLFCFHGYGESADSFNFLEKHLSGKFTLVAIDLPFHGETVWNEGLLFTTKDMIAIIDGIIEALGSKTQNFSVIAFSMGGRMALSLLEHFPSRIEKLVLMAPDGLKVNFWYWLATQTYLGNRFFSLTMKRPGWFLGFLNIASRMKLVNQSIHKFVRYYIHDDQVRQELYDRWTSMRKIRPRLAIGKDRIRKYKIPLILIYGKFDRIIRVERGELFCKNIKNLCTIELLHCGHQVLHEKNIPFLLKYLQ